MTLGKNKSGGPAKELITKQKDDIFNDKYFNTWKDHYAIKILFVLMSLPVFYCMPAHSEVSNESLPNMKSISSNRKNNSSNITSNISSSTNNFFNNVTETPIITQLMNTTNSRDPIRNSITNINNPAAIGTQLAIPNYAGDIPGTTKYGNCPVVGTQLAIPNNINSVAEKLSATHTNLKNYDMMKDLNQTQGSSFVKLEQSIINNSFCADQKIISIDVSMVDNTLKPNFIIELITPRPEISWITRIYCYIILIAVIITIVYCLVNRYRLNNSHNVYEDYDYVDKRREPIVPAVNIHNDALESRPSFCYNISIL